MPSSFVDSRERRYLAKISNVLDRIKEFNNHDILWSIRLIITEILTRNVVVKKFGFFFHSRLFFIELMEVAMLINGVTLCHISIVRAFIWTIIFIAVVKLELSDSTFPLSNFHFLFILQRIVFSIESKVWFLLFRRLDIA